MAYDIQLVEIVGVSFGFAQTNFTGFGNFDSMLYSMWVCLPPNAGITPSYTSSFFVMAVDATHIGLTLYSSSFAGFGTVMFTGNFTPPLYRTRSNILLSVQCSTQTVQIYINDAPASPVNGGWTAVNSFHVNPNNIFRINVGNPSFPPPYAALADIWCTSGTFVDLSIVANRRKFINADLTPVDLGTNGQNPLGSPPVIFQTVPSGGVPNDLLINRGTGSSPFLLDNVNTLDFQSPGVCGLPVKSRPQVSIVGKSRPPA